MSLDDFWDYLWSDAYPTQAAVEAQVKQEARSRAMQEMGAAIAAWRAEDPLGRTCRAEIAADILWLRETFGNRREPA